MKHGLHVHAFYRWFQTRRLFFYVLFGFVFCIHGFVIVGFKTCENSKLRFLTQPQFHSGELRLYKLGAFPMARASPMKTNKKFR